MSQSGRQPPGQATVQAQIEQGRASYARRAWAEAFDRFSALDQAGDENALALEDLDRLAWSAALTGRDAEFLKALERLYRRSQDAGDNPKAARYAFWLVMRLHSIGEAGRASGWFTRLQRLVESAGPDSAERGYLLVVQSIRSTMTGEHQSAADMASQAAEIGERCGDIDLRAFGRCQMGRIFMRMGRITEGLALLDECMLSATTSELSALVTVITYCFVIDACHDSFAIERAREWTQVLSDWCDAQPELAAFRGTCMVDRAEILRIGGHWSQALEQAQRAASRAVSVEHPESIGSAHYQQGEVYRLRGDIQAAELAYKKASQAGANPQPGLALLRLEQGDSESAASGIRRALAEARDPMARARLLPAAIEILLRAEAIDEARNACRELEEIAARFETEAIEALTAHARAILHLHDRDARAALGPLRRAFWVWQKIGAPYAAAKVRIDLARACDELGDREGAELERSAARSTFVELGAALDLASLDGDKQEAAAENSHGLTPRELEVLRLVATGKTNKAIAKELGLSEKTIDRHLSNIFTKVNVTSRAAATAFAYENHLI